MAMPLEVPVAKAVLYALLPILIACYFLLRKGKTYVNLPPMVEKGYSNWTGHVRFILAKGDEFGLPWIPNMKKLADSCSNGVMAVYSFGPKWLTRPTYLVKDPVLISSMLTSSKVKRFSNLMEASKATSGDKHITALTGDELKRHRKLLTACILAKRPMARFVELLTAGVCKYLDTLPTPTAGRPLDLNLAKSKAVGILVVEAFSNFSFGINISCHSEDPVDVERCKKLHSALQFMFKVTGERLVAGPLNFFLKRDIWTNYKLWKLGTFIRREFILPALHQRKEDMSSGVQVPDDAMTMMLESGDTDDAPFSEEEICDEGMVMVQAGYEATAYTFLWLVYHLGQHPEHQELCFKEIREVLSKHPPGSHLTSSDIEELTHLHCVISESMRMQSINDSAAARDTDVDLELGPYTIPAGSTILAVGKCNSLSEESFENADQFKPERWKNDPTGGAKRPGAVNIPFGLGQYRCFGQPLALVALRTLAAVWIQRYRFELLSEDIERTYHATCSPGNLPIRMFPRCVS